ncbi:alkyl sulfatase C-terminal domain-containing protein [Pseudomonas putida]|uniref:alkyl sulfatase C-terminal domain-containing protein n=1 Tax=Pseudomonas putida TaxID=303 RepID=UPI002365DD97|nr:alkyl sulfatase C-terminal domain-containing protein [Pseudomonas putida]MDD2047582.1 hypothetical protein [Pseudomonas putida]
MRYSLAARATAIALSGTPSWATDAASTHPAKAASPTTAAANQAVLNALPFEDRADYEAARRGPVFAEPDNTAARDAQADATAIKQGDIKLDGNAERFQAMLGMLASFQPTFNVVTP